SETRINHDRRIRHHRLRRVRRAPGGRRGHRGHAGVAAGPDRPEAGPPAGRRHHRRRLAWSRHGRHALAARPHLGLPQARRCGTAAERVDTRRARAPGREGGGGRIAFLCIVYTAVVVVLFKLKILRPRPYPIAWVAVAGVLLVGGVVVAWALCAPMSRRVVTTQYVVQLVSYVKGHV